MGENFNKFFTMGLISSVLFSADCHGDDIEELLSSGNCSYPVTEGISDYYSGVTVNDNGSFNYHYSANKERKKIEEKEETEKDKDLELDISVEDLLCDEIEIEEPVIEKHVEEVETNITEEQEELTSTVEEDQMQLNSNIKEAIVNYASEIRESVERQISEDLYMTIVEDNIDGNDVYISHLIISDPDQMEKLIANGGYDRGTETVSSMAAKAGVVWACNGSHFDLGNYSTQDYNNNNIAIVNGEVVHDGGYSVGHEICYSKDGRWFTAPKGASAQDLLDMGVIETYSSLQMPILENGEVSVATSYEEEEELNKWKNRTIIGQTDNGEIFVLTGTTTTRSAAEYLRNKGCNWAKSMDMGGSVTLYANGHLVNEPTDETGERPVIDGIGVLK